MSRLIVLDTETTGMNASNGDRLVELGCVELINREPTGNNLQLYFNPGRDSDPDALKVHGLTTEFLSQFNDFKSHAQEIQSYLKGAEVVIHNASFDVAFMNAEFARAGLPNIEEIADKITDSLMVARRKFPGQKNNLDALCTRFNVSNEHRVLHGALLDAELLSEVWLAMTREQFGLLDSASPNQRGRQTPTQAPMVTGELPVIMASPEELASHDAYLQTLEQDIGTAPVWRQFSG
ncbi:DNA polymerase III subunit epsilon [Brackiella oedipodis]|uniref:DNA polymerase III subunit epsilon n=1 Tax=Brackiella oedipodis TaxID=124225 RepID=UPI000491A6C2|nr:DNA polymerase III subunit epsilon [Brackiella oedipodis]